MKKTYCFSKGDPVMFWATVKNEYPYTTRYSPDTFRDSGKTIILEPQNRLPSQRSQRILAIVRQEHQLAQDGIVLGKITLFCGVTERDGDGFTVFYKKEHIDAWVVMPLNNTISYRKPVYVLEKDLRGKYQKLGS